MSRRESIWKVVCQVCGRVILNTVAKKRWDNLIVCPNDWEQRHPLLRSGPHSRHHPGGEGSAAGRSGGVRTEPDDQSVLVCDVYTSMGVVGYGTTGCARTSTYNTALPLPSLTPPYTGTVPYIDPGQDLFYANLIFLGLFSDNTKTDYSPIRDTINTDNANIQLSAVSPVLGTTSLQNIGASAFDVIVWNTSTEYTSKLFTTAFTIEGFINPVNSATGSFQRILGVHNVDDNSTVAAFNFTNTGLLSGFTSVTLNDTVVATNSEWMYFAFCLGTAGGYKLWTSHSLSTQATLRSKTAFVTPTLHASGQRLYLMSQAGGAGNGFFGKISNIRITGGIDRYGDGTVGVSKITIPVEPFPIY